MEPIERPRILVVGVGGLGCPAAMALAHAGTVELLLVDDDVVEASNLHRQILFHETDVGRPKVIAAAERLRELVPGTRLSYRETRFVPDTALDLLATVHAVVEGADNFATKLLVADACHLARVPVVHAAAVRWVGTVLAVAAHGEPCYRCLFEDLPTGDAPNCAEAGVVGPMVGMVAAMQADLVLRHLAGEDVAGTLLRYDGKSDHLRQIRLRPRADCALCGPQSVIQSIEFARYVTQPCVA